MIIAPALQALRLLRIVELTWIAVLARIFSGVNSLAGNAWACRLVKVVNALPYIVGCYLAGVIGAWDAALSPHIAGATCAGIMTAYVCGSWLSEWWRR
ncbi:MAG: hypothetical protein J2P51_09130 [Hyphomicrobiaceae bacterium]|nr:hypothetical protein [Hyphomicrobiaceae bacterium]